MFYSLRAPDLMVTFATGSVATMAVNWVKNVQKAGIDKILLGTCSEWPCLVIAGDAAQSPAFVLRGVLHWSWWRCRLHVVSCWTRSRSSACNKSSSDTSSEFYSRIAL